MKKTIVSAVAVAGLTMAFTAQAQSFSQHEIGVIGQSTELDNVSNEDVTEFGAFYNLHNMNTIDNGYIYKAHIDWTMGDEDGLDVTTYDFGYTSGYRMDISSNTTLDLLAGIGHKNVELEYQSQDATIDSTYFRYGAALQTNASADNTLRLEVGSRLNVNGDYDGGGTSASIENDNNLYVEASLMTKTTGVPMRFSAFYENKEYEFDNSQFGVDSYTTGLKISTLF